MREKGKLFPSFPSPPGCSTEPAWGQQSSVLNFCPHPDRNIGQGRTKLSIPGNTALHTPYLLLSLMRQEAVSDSGLTQEAYAGEELVVMLCSARSWVKQSADSYSRPGAADGKKSFPNSMNSFFKIVPFGCSWPHYCRIQGLSAHTKLTSKWTQREVQFSFSTV